MSDPLKRAADLTPEQVSRLVMARKQRQPAAAPASTSAGERIERRAGEGPVPLSFAQQRLWLLDRLEPGNAAYNLGFPARLSGDLDAAVLARCLSEIVRRHESLRTRFALADGTDGEPVQVIEAAAPLPLPRLDLSALPEEAGRREARRLATADSATPFDLARGPLVRSTLATLGRREHLLLLAMHHIVSDGWSFGVFFGELRTLYDAFAAGRPSPLPELPIQYADFALWQRQWLRGPALTEQLSYWRKQLAGAAPVLELPTDRLRPPVQTHRGSHLELRIPGDLAAALKELSRRAGATLFMTLLAAFKVVLHRWAGQDDVVIGAPSAGRQWVATEKLIGFFLNTLVLRTDLSGNPGFLALLARVREVVLAAYRYQEVPFEKLLEELQPERQLSRSPLFQVLFNMTNLPPSSLALSGLSVEPLDLTEPLTKFDFTLYVEEKEGGIQGDLVYNADLFDRARMAALLAGFRHLLVQAVAAPETPIEALSLVAPETAALLPDPLRPLPRPDGPGPVHGRVPLHAARAPERLALADADCRWTYGELEAGANQLAHRLLAAGLERGEVVAIYAHRSASLPWAILATLKAGGAFMVLDPAYPPARLAEYLEIARPAALLALAQAGAPPAEVEAALSTLPLRLRLTLPSRSESSDLLAGLPADDPAVEVGPDDLACLTFTSGSTGRPKGVLGRHGPLSAFQPWWAERFALSAGDRFAMLSALSHDPLQRDILTPLWLGAELCIPDPERLGEPGWLAGWTAREEVTVLHLTPAMLEILTTAAAAPLLALRRAFVVGDLLKRGEVARLQELAPSLLAVNLYGSTETQRSVAYSVVPRPGEGLAGREVLPLGRGIEGVELLVVNPTSGLLAGIGEVGEILVRSRALARGYLGDEALTAARFLPNPFRGGDAADRVYRTGDLGRYRPDGEVEFAGRVDQQVKVRGFRIEPGEIEAALRRHPAVRECVVVARGEGAGRRLAAYLAPRQGSAPVAARDLRAFLAALLPDYMVPADLVWLDALPLTPTGKVDRRALPAPEALAGEAGEGAAGPRTPTEELLAGIWVELLNVPGRGRGTISVHDNFFALGGHSLLATRVLSRIREALGVEIPLRALFEAPTIEGLAQAVERSRGGELPPSPPLSRVPRGTIGAGGLPLSFAQQRFWILEQLAPGSPAHSLSAAVRLHGALAVAALARAVGEIVRRHEVLSTVFVAVDEEEPRQMVGALASGSPLAVLDLEALSRAAQDAAVERLAVADARRPFDLAKGPLLRTTLLRLGEGEHVLLLALHHIVTDGWSLGIFTRELSALYAAFAAGRPSPLPELPIQYGDFAVWQRGWLQGEALARQLDHWRGHLAGAPQVLALPADRPRPPVQSHRGGRLFRTLPQELAQALAQGSRRRGVTLFMTLFAGFAALLARFSGEDDLVIGTPIANRGRRELEELIGLFANTLALRARTDGDPSFAELSRRVRETALAAYAHQDLPFERLVDELKPARDLGHSPIFQVFFILQNTPPPVLELGDLRFSRMEVPAVKAQFDLALTLIEIEGELLARLEYATDLFAPATAERLLGYYASLIAGAAAHPEGPISALPLLSAAERQQLLVEWNDTATAGTAEIFPLRFAAQARRRPDATAMVFGTASLTYGELDARADRLARRLRALGVGPEAIVGLCLPRSFDLVVAMLAVLKAGGAFLPLDPTHPRERRDYVLADSRASMVLDGGWLAGEREGLAGVSADPPAAAPDGSSLAYVIYTSGSTGRPKGVLVEHRNLAAVLEAGRRELSLDADDRMPVLAPAVFDIFLFELFGPLAVGATAILVELDPVPDLGELVRLLGRVTRFHAVPALLQQVVDRLREEGEPVSSLRDPQPRTVLTGGDVVPASLLADLRQLFPATEIRVLYGPTEGTILASSHAVPREEEGPRSLLGRSLPGVELRLYDWRGRSGQPVPIGVPGEIWIGGAGVARGYLGRDELTAERFPWLDGRRWYRSGDLARRLADGNLEFLGRSDDQVKVRGFRVEPGEIEAALARHPAVREAVVLARPDAAGDRRLVAYLVTAAGASPDAAALRAHLKARLPEYMVPSLFLTLPELPLSPNGKVDRKALSRIDLGERSAEGTGEGAPRTPVEQALAGIWSELLGCDRVGVFDDFFALGGHSLLATRVLARVRRLFGVDLGIRALFDAPTVAGLARAVERARETQSGPDGPSLKPVPRGAGVELPASFGQQRLWFLDRLQPGSAHYNLPMAFRLRGRWEPGLLAASLAGIVRRHEALRTTFAESGEGPVQVIAPIAATGPALWQVDLSALPGERGRAEGERLLQAEALRPFDLVRGPLFRPFLFRGPGAEQVLLLAMHHAISDGWSVGVLLRELLAFYQALVAGEPLAASPLPVQYADFALWQRQWLAGPVLAAQLAYWRERLAGHPPVLELPADRPRPAVQSFRGAAVRVALGMELSTELIALSRQQRTPLFMTVLAGWKALLGRMTGKTDLLVGVPSAGRMRLELEGLIGFFVNTLVLRTDLAGDPTFAGLVGRVRETALGAYAHGDLPLERLVEELAPERSLSWSPLFQVAFDLAAAAAPTALPDGLSWDPLKLSMGVAKFDLTLALAESAEGLVGGLEYSRDLFDATTAERLVGHLATLLSGAAAAPDLPLSALPLLGAGERAQALWEWNDTARSWPDLLVPEMLDRAAGERPDAVAVVASGLRLSYGELLARADRLARRLRALGVGPEVPVVVCAGRSAERVVGVVAIVRAGGAFVSLDPAWPRERLADVLAEVGAPVVLADERSAAGLPEGAPVILLDGPGEIDSGDGLPPAGLLTPESLAYIIYTSGSTGRPKGVAVPHAGLANLVRWHQMAFGLTAEDHGTQVAGPAFDAWIWELWPLLAAGATVHIPDEETRISARRTVRFWADEGLTLPYLPTPLAEQVLEEGVPAERLAARALFIGGDRLHRRPDPALTFRLTNHYGPAEYSVVTTEVTVAPEGEEERVPTIGRALPNTQMYVLDAHLGPLPPGVLGELSIGGIGLARGYLRRPDVTAERFVPDPWGALHGTPGARMYRTGDLVRRLADGDLDFVGRADHQVKLRGMRVELGEIEATLDRHPAVGAAVVALREDRPGDRRLAAYVVPAEPEAPAEIAAALSAFLEQHLPAHMVPQDWVLLAALPLTVNGKVDRRALPAPERREAGGTAPRTPLEEVLAGIFCAVLKREWVGIEDDFFALGGHSLSATQVVARVRDALALELPLRVLFEEPTVAGLARWIEAAQPPAGAIRRTPAPPLVRAARGPETLLPLSFAQQRLWFIDRLEPGSPLYNVPAAFRLEGALAPAALAAALAEIVRRHEALRTTFTVAAAGEPVQVIAPAGASSCSLWQVDLAALPAESRAAELARLAAAEAERPFDLARGPLLRTTLVRLGAEEHALLLSLHHVVSDGWSMGLLLHEIAALYGAALAGRPSPLPELPVQYADFALWQRGWLQGEVLTAEIGFWRERLAGMPAALELPTDRPRPAVQSFRGASRRALLPPSRAAAVAALSRELHATPFIVLLAAFHGLLGRQARQEDVAVGSPIAGRTHREIEELIGFFVNTLVLRADLSGAPTFAELVARVREVVLQAHAHQNVPFERLVEALEPERSLSHTPLFQVMFLYQDLAFDDRLPGLALAPIGVVRRTAKFDLLLSLSPAEEGLYGAVEYSADLFDATTAERLLRRFDRLLAAALADPRARFADLDLLAPAERAQLLVEWNDSAGPRAPVACVHDFLTVQARSTPDRVALAFGGVGGGQVTYGQLAARTARLASALVSLGVGPEVPVAISVGRSLAMIEGLVAIFRAGGYAVALDPTYPAERLAFMLADTAAPVLLADAGSLALLPPFSGALLRLDDPGCAASLARLPADTPPGPLGENLAYVIYTSGSTGRPKGIAMPHRAIVNVVELQRRSSGAAAARTLQFSPLSFDVCFQEIFSTWQAGGTLFLISDADRRDPLTLLRMLERHEVERLFLPFVALQNLIEMAERLGSAPRALQEIVTAGEQLKVGDLLVRWFERMPHCRLENQYGPSEAHVVTAFPLAGPPAAWPALPPVGRPVLSTRVHLLDSRMAPVPLGVPGEVHVGGVQVARGYLGRPELTAERFLPDPFAGIFGAPGGRLYRTGDLARLLPGGDLEFLGRVDFQVKVRGFRIELGEIEAVLADHPALSAVVVAAPEIAGLRRLVAYVVPVTPGDAARPDGALLRRFLAERLPGYMVPSHFMVMDALPIAATGKVDHRALPLPDGRPEGEELVLPRTPLEEEVAAVWAEVLGLTRVGIHDSFWDLGGHSLSATKVLSRLYQALGVELPLQTLFKAPTITGLTAAIGEALLSASSEDGEGLSEEVLAELESF